MLNSVALDVVIGLVFIYLLYSLFATVLSEIIATYIGLRARNLKEAVDRMLNDDPGQPTGFLMRLWDSLKLTKNPTNPRITNFYNHPEIKYLGSTGIFKVPSQFKAVSFSKTLLGLLNEIGYQKTSGTLDGSIPVTHVTKERLDAALEGLVKDHQTLDADGKMNLVLDADTTKYVMSLWKESYGDLVKFRLYIEGWFDRTMEQCLEWYKRKIQIVLLALGFLLAWFFNADTFSIIKRLSNDKDAREQMVKLAAAYLENNKAPGDPALNLPPGKIDSLLKVQEQLQNDIEKANSILGLGGWLPDSVRVLKDPATGTLKYLPEIEPAYIDAPAQADGFIRFDKGDKMSYLFKLLLPHFFGFLITAIAISLGAPFWFDLLNKLMKLRTSVKQNTDSAEIAPGANGGVSHVNRVG